MEPNLYVQTAFLGDMLLGIPALRAFKKTDPDRPLTLYCRKGVGRVFKELNLVDEIIEVDKSKSESRQQAIKALLSQEYHKILCPHQSVSSLRLVGKCRAQEKLGYQSWLSWWYFNRSIKRPLPLPESIRQLALVGLLDQNLNEQLMQYQSRFTPEVYDLDRVPSASNASYVPSWASMSARKELLELLKTHESGLRERFSLGDRPLVAIAPGSVWGTKRWTKEGYSQVAHHFQKDHQVILLGAPNEKDLCDQIAGYASGAISTVGASIIESAMLITMSDYMITNDCGAMHLAALADTPTVCMFGPTILPFGYRPWQNRALVLENTNLDCRPCGKHGPQVCPIGTHECMTSIAPIEVIAAVSKLNR